LAVLAGAAGKGVAPRGRQHGGGSAVLSRDDIRREIMATKKRVGFEFKNQIAPRYIDLLLLQLEYDQWYDSNQLKQLLRQSGLDVRGSEIVSNNRAAWVRLGLGEVRHERRIISFRLTPFGKQIVDLYSTNRDLFYEIFHFLFYSAWRRSGHMAQASFWLYGRVCDHLWDEAPNRAKTTRLSARLQAEAQEILGLS